MTSEYVSETKKQIEEGRFIEASFQGFLRMVIPDDACQAQIDDMRLVFFSGAQMLYAGIMTTLDPCGEPTDADLRRLCFLQAELSAFVIEFNRKFGISPEEKTK